MYRMRMLGRSITRTVYSAIYTLAMLSGIGAFAQPGPPLDVNWIPNNEVSAVAIHDDSIFLAGSFRGIGIELGALALASRNSASLTSEREVIRGQARVIEPDGHQGWYVYGRFRLDGAESVDQLIRVNAYGELDRNFKPRLSAEYPIMAMVAYGRKLHAFGVDFYVQFDANTGERLFGDFTLARFSSVAVMGNYMVIAGQPMNWLDDHVAALHVVDKFTLQRVPDFDFSATPAIMKMTASGGVIYYLYRKRNTANADQYLAAFNTLDGKTYEYGEIGSETVNALAYHDGRLYLGGNFTFINRTPRARLAAFDVFTGTLTDWAPSADRSVLSIEGTDEGIYVAGDFRTINNVPRPAIARIDNGVLSGWAPNLQTMYAFNQNMKVFDVGASSTGLMIAGNGLLGDSLPRVGFVELDAETGEPTEMVVETDGTIGSVAVANDTLYIGGDFSLVQGEPRINAAAIDLNTGLLTDWAPTPLGAVSAFHQNESTLYLTGAFRTIRDIPRNGLAAFDLATGALTDLVVESFEGRLSVSDTQLVTGTRDHYRIHDPITGSLVDEYLVPDIVPDSREVSSITAIDAIDTETYLFKTFTRSDGIYSSINCQQGTYVRWASRKPGAATAYAMKRHGGVVYIGDEGGVLYGVDAMTGEFRDWRSEGTGPLKVVAATPEVLVAAGGFSSAKLGNLPNLAIIPREPIAASVDVANKSIEGDTASFEVSFDRDVVFYDQGLDVLVNHNGTAHTQLLLEAGASVYTVTVGGLSGHGTLSVTVLPSSDVEDEHWNTLSVEATSPLVAFGRPEDEGSAGDGEGEAPDGEGSPVEGEGETPDGEGSGGDGEGEGNQPEGEGEAPEGEGAAGGPHAADVDGNLVIDLSEVLRVVQLRNAGGYGCDSSTEDGFSLSMSDRTCNPHSADSIEQDWNVSLSELLRVIQIYNAKVYTPCTESADGACLD